MKRRRGCQHGFDDAFDLGFKILRQRAIPRLALGGHPLGLGSEACARKTSTDFAIMPISSLRSTEPIATSRLPSAKACMACARSRSGEVTRRTAPQSPPAHSVISIANAAMLTHTCSQVALTTLWVEILMTRRPMACVLPDSVRTISTGGSCNAEVAFGLVSRASSLPDASITSADAKSG